MSSLYVTLRKAAFAEAIRLRASLRVHQSFRELRHDPFSGKIFVFPSKQADRLKILAWDGSGLVLLRKRLEHNAFRWPPISDGVMRLSA